MGDVKHTRWELSPGDWGVEQPRDTDTGSTHWHHVVDQSGKVVALVVDDGQSLHPQQEFSDRCNLIAAAPELLEALKWMVELCHHANPSAFSNGVTDSTGSIDEGDVIASRIIGAARAAIAKATGQGGE